ncbi:MAG: hypothetical protein KDI09_17035 [Halioglobus sp.]|nr:hypothetical protein [Halioglobus sp.]
MFVGHYAAGLALKSVEKRTSLGILFLAVQFVDILFFPFVLMGVERPCAHPDLAEHSAPGWRRKAAAHLRS